MYKYEAKEITGGLSAPGKMPEGSSYNLPARAHAITGAKLRKIEGHAMLGLLCLQGPLQFQPKMLTGRLARKAPAPGIVNTSAMG